MEALQAIRYANAAEKPTLVAIDGSAKLERWVIYFSFGLILGC